MKQHIPIYLFLAFSALLQAKPASSQNIDSLITVHFRNIPLADAFFALNAKYNLNIAFSKTIIAEYTTGIIHSNQYTIKSLLFYLCGKYPLRCSFKEGMIMIIPEEDTQPESAPPKKYSYSGHVTNQDNEPLYGAVVKPVNENILRTTSEDGFYTITSTQPSIKVSISYTGYNTAIIDPAITQEIVLSSATSNLVPVEIQSGMQKLSPEMVTGSYNSLNTQTIERNSYANNFLDRINGLTNAVSITRNIPTGSLANEGAYSVRGRSTINSNPLPLLIVDNVPFQGNINDINPNDIQNITILKDAAATSIWGAFSGNGVITITTKKPQPSQPHFTLISTTTVATKPNVKYSPTLSSPSYIEFEKQLFQNNFNNIAPSSNSYLSAAVDLLNKNKNNQLSTEALTHALDSMSHIDIRNDISKYYYRPGINQRFFLSAQAVDENTDYYFSLGVEKAADNLVRNSSSKTTLTLKLTHYFLNRKLTLSFNSFLSQTNTALHNDGGPVNRPYTRLADDNGTPISVPATYRNSYKDTIGDGLLLNWNYKPLDDFSLSNIQLETNHRRINLGANYKIGSLNISLLYQFINGQTTNTDLKNKHSFYVRNLVNMYSQIDYASRTVYRPIPYGDISDEINFPYSSNNERLLITYNKHFFHNLQVISLAGTDINQTQVSQTIQRLYNYKNDVYENYTPVSYVTAFPILGKTGSAAIPNFNANSKTQTNFLSYYTHHIISLWSRYSLSASVRRDATNLVGVKTNAKGVPLWSVGGAWRLDRENFIHTPALQELKVRASYGKAGNVNNAISALTSATYSSTPNRFGSTIGRISNPANENLRWEKVSTFNIGIDLNVHNRLYGSIDAYWKKADDLISEDSINPTLGLSTYTGNFGQMKTRGVELQLSYTPIQRKNFSWRTSLILNWNYDKVTRAKTKNITVYEYFVNGKLTPTNNYPLYALFAIPYKGLDQNGNPVVVINGTPGTNYNAFASTTNRSHLQYMGASRPTQWGSVMNDFHFHHFDISIFISYKAGYYFRKPSIQYYSLATDINMGHPDFDKRWRKAGDEMHTTVPSSNDPFNSGKEFAYTYSHILVAKGDHIRLENIKISYQLSKYVFSFISNNIGILWRSNKDHIDPDYIPNGTRRIVPPSTTFTFNITAHL